MIKNPCGVCGDATWSNKKSGIRDGIYQDFYCDRCHTMSSFEQVEFVPDRIKQERIKHAKDIVQPWRSGELSKEYIDAHGTKGLNVTQDQVKNAKNVWKGDVAGL
jgi:hypothetical protein